MIDPKKQYRTRDGREVRIYAVDGAGLYSVHGAVLDSSGWINREWAKDGTYCGEPGLAIDLIEVRPRIKREMWVNVYRGRETMWMTIHDEKDEADNHTDATTSRRIACVEIDIDVEEGHGL